MEAFYHMINLIKTFVLVVQSLTFVEMFIAVRMFNPQAKANWKKNCKHTKNVCVAYIS